MKWINMNGRIYGFLSRMVDLIWLNILVLIGCIPVITIGSSITAMYYILFKMQKDEEGYLTKTFFRVLRENFRQATLVWVANGLILGFFWVDLSIIRSGMLENQKLQSILEGILFFGAILLAAVMQYVFPMMAKYQNSSKELIKNAFVFVILNIPKTLFMLVVSWIPFLILTKSDFFIFYFMLIGITLPAYICTFIMNKQLEEVEQQKKNI